MKCVDGRTFSKVIRKKNTTWKFMQIMCNVNWRLIGLTINYGLTVVLAKQLYHDSFGLSWKRLIGSLSTHVFETRTVIGSELFSLLTCPHTTTFTFLRIFSPLEMSSIKIWERRYGTNTRNVLFRLPSASQKRACLRSLLQISYIFYKPKQEVKLLTCKRMIDLFVFP